MKYIHIPVLQEELMNILSLQPGSSVIDATIGGGGHSKIILEQIGPQGKLLGIDRDPASIKAASKTLKKYAAQITLVQGNFKDIKKIAHEHGYNKVHSVLLDLGFSSYHVDSSGRGFSYTQEENLDMRYDPHGSDITAGQIINTFPEKKIAEILWMYGEERLSRIIAAEIVKQRRRKKIRTTRDLEEIIHRVATGKQKQKQISQFRHRSHTRIHPAARSFQALRIAVNDELTNLEHALTGSIEILDTRGVLCVISFHSLEDRIVKRFFNKESRDCICDPDLPECRCNHHARISIVTKKPIQPLEDERGNNPRSRSAKMRVAKKI